MHTLESITDFIKQDIIVDMLEVVVSTDEIIENTQLIGGGLDLDSIEIMDLVVSLEKKYHFKFKDFPEETLKDKMASLDLLVQFVFEQAASKIEETA